MKVLKILLIGYGRMGKEVEKVALERGHQIVAKIDQFEDWEKMRTEIASADLAIEFSVPQSVLGNIEKCFSLSIPIVVGTTGWMDQLPRIRKLCEDKNQAIFYASNFSIGVNLFFAMNRYLAKYMRSQKQYGITIEESHHIHKLDSPSGTALTLFEQIMSEMENETEIPIHSIREGEIVGEHKVFYTSEMDQISITHQAKSRATFAQGAVSAAEYLHDKKGCHGMSDLLNL